MELRADGLTKSYRKRTVVDGVELSVSQGEIVGLLGPNGAGKTTTFYMIVGMVRPEAGRILLDDDDLTDVPMYKRARRGIGYLAQESSVFRELTVEKNIEAVLEFQPISKEERQERVESLIADLGLERVRQSKGYTPYPEVRGDAVRLHAVLPFDPVSSCSTSHFAGIDPIAVEEVQQIVAGLKMRGIGVLVTDHNVHETMAITDRAYLLYEGKILKHGTSEVLANDPEVRKRYLGEKFSLERY